MKVLQAIGIVLALTCAAFGQAEKLLEGARHKEVMEGDLKGAIEQYRKLAQQYAKQPEVAAQALYRMGECQEKLGQAEARKSYERVVREYAGDSYAAQAKAKLAAMGGAASGGPRVRLVWDDAIDTWGGVSPDGGLLSFVDWSSGDLAIRDLRTGVNRRLTNKGGYAKAHAECAASVISADGKWVAFLWDRYDSAAKREGEFELRVVRTDGTDERLLMRSSMYFLPEAWSPDGKWIAASAEVRKEGGNGILLVSVDTGETRELILKGPEWKNQISFSPDGRWLAYWSETPRGSGKSVLYTVRADGSDPGESEVVADAKLMGWAQDGSGIYFLRSSDAGSALYLLPISAGKPSGYAKLILSPLQNVEQFLGVAEGERLFFSTGERRMDAWVSEIDPRTGQLGKRLAQFPVQRLYPFLVSSGVQFSPDGKEFFASVPKQGVLFHDMATGSERTMMPQMAQIRRLGWTPDGKSLLALGTGKDGRQGLHRLDLATGAAVLLGEIPTGREVADIGDGKHVYLQAEGILKSRDLQTGQEKTILDLAPKGVRGFEVQVFFSRDRQWVGLRASRGFVGVVHLASGEVKELYRAREEEEVLWGAGWSGDGKSIIAIAKRLTRGRTSEILVIPIDGGPVVRAAAPVQLRGLSLSPDGKYVASVDYANRDQVWVAEGLRGGK